MLRLDQDMRARMIPKHDCYASAVETSVEANSPLILIVGGHRHDLEATNLNVQHVPAGTHNLPNGVIVSKGGFWLKTLPMDAPAESVRRALGQQTNAVSLGMTRIQC